MWLPDWTVDIEIIFIITEFSWPVLYSVLVKMAQTLIVSHGKGRSTNVKAVSLQISLPVHKL